MVFLCFHLNTSGSLTQYVIVYIFRRKGGESAEGKKAGKTAGKGRGKAQAAQEILHIDLEMQNKIVLY